MVYNTTTESKFSVLSCGWDPVAKVFLFDLCHTDDASGTSREPGKWENRIGDVLSLSVSFDVYVDTRLYGVICFSIGVRTVCTDTGIRKFSGLGIIVK